MLTIIKSIEIAVVNWYNKISELCFGGTIDE